YHSVIDFIFYNNCSNIEINKTFTFFIPISDHLPVITDFSTNPNKKLCPTVLNYHSLRYKPIKSLFKIKIMPIINNLHDRIINIKLNGSTAFTFSTVGRLGRPYETDTYKY